MLSKATSFMAGMAHVSLSSQTINHLTGLRDYMHTVNTEACVETYVASYGTILKELLDSESYVQAKHCALRTSIAIECVQVSMTAHVCITYILTFAKLSGTCIYKYLDMFACIGYISISSVQVIQGLHARFSDHCTGRESKVCTTKSMDGPNPYFVHNIHVYM